jgi:hypothetical protein
MNWIEIYAQGSALVIERGSPGAVEVRSFTEWWRYFYKENAVRAIDETLPDAWVTIDSLRIV